jgi:small-conductance mechanosensitive channel
MAGLVAVFGLTQSMVAVAQQGALATEAPAAAAEPQPAEDGRESAQVVIDGRPLFRIVGISSIEPGKRARAIEDKLIAFARDTHRPVSELRAVPQERHTQILAGTQKIAVIHDIDAALEGIDRNTLVTINMARIVEAIEQYRAEREPAYLLRHVVYALIGTLLLLAYIVAVRWLRMKARAVIDRRYARLMLALEGKSKRLVRARWIGDGLRTVGSAAVFVLVAGGVFLYAGYVLELFPWTRPVGERLIGMFTRPLVAFAEGIGDALPGLAFLLVLYFITRAVLRFLHMAFSAVASGNVQFEGFDPDWAVPTYKIVRTLVVVFALVVAYPYVPGSESQAFKGISIMLGIMFSLGSTSIISNLVAGYTMTYRRAFRRGDIVRVGDSTGRVTDVRLQVTHLRNLRNEEIIIPNSEILANSVVNYSSLGREQALFIRAAVGIGYEVPWRQVESMLLTAAVRTEGVLADPAPFVLVPSLGDFAVSYEINAAIDDPTRRLSRLSALHRNVLDVFNEYGVQIMTPAYEGDPEQAKIVPREQWYVAPARPPAAAGGSGAESTHAGDRGGGAS